MLKGQETNHTQLSQGESAIEGAIFSVNNFVILIINLVTQLAEYTASYLLQVQSGHFHDLNFTNVLNESRILSCTANENNTLINLLNNDSQTLRHCLQNVKPMSTQLLMSVSNLLEDISDTITDILTKLNSCLNDDLNILETAACIYSLQKPINNDLSNVTRHLNNTIALSLKIIPAATNKTTSCLISQLNDFLHQAYNLLVNYSKCLAD